MIEFVRERDDSRAEFCDFGFQSVDLRLLPEDDLAELLEVVLDVHQQEFDVDDSIVGGGSGHEISILKKRKNGCRHSAIGFRPGMVGGAGGNSSSGCDTLAVSFS